jgi:hypothetical protein
MGESVKDLELSLSSLRKLGKPSCSVRSEYSLDKFHECLFGVHL